MTPVLGDTNERSYFMTNPISKAIVKAAVAMGYGKKSDYKGSSVADVLEKFAAIAKDKGSSSGGCVVYATFTEDNGTWSCDKTYAELKAAYDAGSVVIAIHYYHMDNSDGIIYAPMIYVPESSLLFCEATIHPADETDVGGYYFVSATIGITEQSVIGLFEHFRVAKMK